MEIEITNVLLSDNLTIRETVTLEELFHITEKRPVTNNGMSYYRYDCLWESRIKEIVCTFKHYFLNGFQNPNDVRMYWVKHPKHHVTRILKKLASVNLPIKIKYNSLHKSLILYR